MQQPQSYRQALGSFGPFGTSTLDELPQSYRWFEEMRTKHPVFLDGRLPVWQIFRYDDVLQATTDYKRFSSVSLLGAGSFLEDTLVVKDPPDHRKLRNLVNQAFTPRAVAHLSDRITAITQELLDRVREQGKMDVVTDMAFPLPAKVIAEMLGVPAEDWAIFRRWARAGADTRGDQSFPNMRDELSNYFSDLLRDRRRMPREDLITSLSVAEVDGERLSEEELINFCILLLAAGQETTKNLIANAIVCFTDHPDMMERVIQNPALMPSAIEEVLRYLPPVWFIFRTTTTDVELSGQTIPAQQPVLVWLASANHDPAQFPDPERFDVQREPNRHLGFGHGIHFCVGAPLARLEAKIALPMMLEQLKGIQRVNDEPLLVNRGIVFIIRNLPITFQSA
jgi:cytochrome P450